MSRHSTRPSQEQMQEADAMEAIASNTETLTDNNFSVPQHLSSGTITRHFSCEFMGSLAEMADSPSLATWSEYDLLNKNYFL